MKYFIGIKENRIKLTTDVDCLGPDIKSLASREFENDQDLINTIRETCRVDETFHNKTICIDTLETFIEDKAINI